MERTENNVPATNKAMVGIEEKIPMNAVIPSNPSQPK